MKPERTYCVYVLARPNGKPFYVGCTGDLLKRLTAHEYEARRGCDCAKCEIIRAIWRRGGQVQQTIVCTTSDADAAYATEAEWTEAIGWGRLTNQIAGGGKSMRRSPALTARMRRVYRDRAARNAARSRAAREECARTWNWRADRIFRQALTIANNATEAGRILKLSEAASVLRVCDRVAKRLIREGHIAGRQVSIRKWEVNPASVHAYLSTLGYVPGYAPMRIEEIEPA